MQESTDGIYVVCKLQDEAELGISHDAQKEIIDFYRPRLTSLFEGIHTQCKQFADDSGLYIDQMVIEVAATNCGGVAFILSSGHHTHAVTSGRAHIDESARPN